MNAKAEMQVYTREGISSSRQETTHRSPNIAIETVSPTLVSTATIIVAPAKQTAKTNCMYIYDHS